MTNPDVEEPSTLYVEEPVTTPVMASTSALLAILMTVLSYPDILIQE